MDHLLEMCPRDSRFRLALFVNKVELFGDVVHAEQQEALARQSVPASAPGFLIIALQIFGRL
jgi:hypothetical protein